MTISKHFLSATLSSFLAVALLCATFFIAEPTIGGATVTSGPFSVRQQISEEISFMVGAANVTMVGALSAITGGFATGTTQVVVRTTAAGGYQMSIAFSDANLDAIVMEREGGGTNVGSIRDYPSVGGEPTFNFSTASSAAMFAYTVNASSSNIADIDHSFYDNGTNCNATTTPVFNLHRCWMEPTTTSFRLVNRTVGSAPAGATTTVIFRVFIPANPSPPVDAGFYTATATLTAVNN
jgi:hypothetical protein